MIYDGGKSTVTGFNGDLDFKLSEMFDLYGKLEYRKYALATEAEAWNLPTAKLTAGTNFRINKKIMINGALLIRGETKDRLPATGTAYQVVALPAFADLSGGIDYQLSKRVSIFAQANNLLNTKYQTYLYYPVNGFNIFGGLSVGF
ncbi:MAG: TonB-dependent receptor [Sphingobacteriaceae bacterium]|nr:MAG: TonB-dependent receptor [Sphingobacteriaceae bacterium]